MTDVLQLLKEKNESYSILNECYGEKKTLRRQEMIITTGLYISLDLRVAGTFTRHPYRAAIRECLPAVVSRNEMALIINQGGLESQWNGSSSIPKGLTSRYAWRTYARKKTRPSELNGAMASSK